jgi:uncharacterized radical SAM superfamily Fe-S cluster-containing enzyme
MTLKTRVVSAIIDSGPKGLQQVTVGENGWTYIKVSSTGIEMGKDDTIEFIPMHRVQSVLYQKFIDTDPYSGIKDAN